MAYHSDLDRAIHENSVAMEYRQQSLRNYYTRKIVDFRIGAVGWFIVGTQALFLMFFCALYIMSYIPQTKPLVTIVLP